MPCQPLVPPPSPAERLDHAPNQVCSQATVRRLEVRAEVGRGWAGECHFQSPNRNLPNVELESEDGRRVKKLRYVAKDETGLMKGVCPCNDPEHPRYYRKLSSGDTCDKQERQPLTLIPWCLPHTGNRHNHWAGLFGRCGWHEHLPTCTTEPHPMAKQVRCPPPTPPLATPHLMFPLPGQGDPSSVRSFAVRTGNRACAGLPRYAAAQRDCSEQVPSSRERCAMPHGTRAGDADRACDCAFGGGCSYVWVGVR